MFVAALNYGYRQFQEASKFLCEHLEFAVIHEDEQSVTVSNGAVCVRLHHGD